MKKTTLNLKTSKVRVLTPADLRDPTGAMGPCTATASCPPTEPATRCLGSGGCLGAG